MESSFTYGDVEAGFDTLMRQASMTSHDYLAAAKRILEEKDLKYTTADVIALAAVSAQDYHSAMVAGGLSGIAHGLRALVDELELHRQ